MPSYRGYRALLPFVGPRLVPALFAGGAWSLAVFRLMHRLGQHDAALAVALLLGLAVLATVARWTFADAERAALEAERCPRCRTPLRPEHLDTVGAGRDGAVRLWECGGCGYRHGEPLTRGKRRP